jgi:predicted DCC family thiol-disulfide oxidoreductase YuxK
MATKKLLLIYDDECPACRNYTQMIRIKETVGELILINAREDGDEVSRLSEAGFDLDEGMALIVGTRVYYGADTVHMLALMGSPSGMFNRLNHWVFRSRARSKMLYPVLKAGRNLLLKILARSKMNNLNIDGNDKF